MIERAANSVIASLLLALAAPFFALAFLIRRPRIRWIGVHGRLGSRVRYPVVRLSRRPGLARAFNYAPVLLAVALGRIDFMGPRVAWCARQRPRYAHFGARPGLVSAHLVQRRASIAHDSEDESDARFIRNASFAAKLTLAGRFALSLLFGVRRSPMPARVRLLDVEIANVTMESALASIAAMARGPRLAQVAFVNADCFNIAARDREYQGLLERADLAFGDGIGLRLALRWFSGIGLRDNVNGTDLFPRLCRIAQRETLGIFLLGAAPGVAQAVARNAEARHPGLRIAGFHDGYFSEAQAGAVVRAINESGAHILLVAMGAPRQERWIARHADELRPRVAIGVGGLFDFYAGRIRRAPLWMREMGLEWIYRMLQEPRRMWRRYVVGNPLFLLRSWRWSRSARATPVAQDDPRRGVAMTATRQATPVREALPAYPGLAERAAEGALWSIAQNGAKHGLSFLLFLALARLLDPHAYGLVAICMAIIALANVVMEQGLSDALVQRREVEEGHLSTAFAIHIGTGTLLTVAAQFAAGPLARLAGQPETVDILRALSLLFVINALAGVPQALLQRRLLFRPLAIRIVSSLVVGGAVGVALAWHSAGPWSLVGQQLAGAATGSLVLYLSVRWRPRARPSLRHARELWAFGRHVMGAGLLDFVNRKSDDLIVGFFLGPIALGFYSVAYQMLTVLEQLVCKGLDAVALSTFSRLQCERERVCDALYTTARLASVFAFPVFIGAWLVADDAVAGLLGPAWATSVPVLKILLAIGLVHSVFHYHHAAFKACGVPALSVRLGLIEAVVNVIAFLAVVRWGIEAVAAAYVVRAYALSPLSLRALRATVGISYARYLSQVWPALAASVAMALTVLAVRAALPAEFGPVTRLLLLTACGLIAYALWIRLLFPQLFEELRGRAALAMKRPGAPPQRLAPHSISNANAKEAST